MKCDAIQHHRNVPFENEMKCEHLFVLTTSLNLLFLLVDIHLHSVHLSYEMLDRDKNIEFTKIREIEWVTIDDSFPLFFLQLIIFLLTQTAYAQSSSNALKDFDFSE